MKKLYIIGGILMLFQAIHCWGQDELRVDTMYYDSSDLEARANVKSDLNGNPYALIKISLPLSDAVVEKSAVVGPTQTAVGELWAYVTAGDDYGASQITLQHAAYHPLTIKFSDWGIHTIEGKCVYRMVVSVPSASLTQANIAYERLQLTKARGDYKLVLENENASEYDKTFAQRRLSGLPELISINNAATQYAKRYIDLQKSENENGIKKKDIIQCLDSAIYWYRTLYRFSSIAQAKTLSERFENIRYEIVGSKIIEGAIDIMEKKNRAVWIKRKREKLENVIVKITKKNMLDEEETMIIHTDDNARFRLELKNSFQVILQFEYREEDKRFVSSEIESTEDNKLTITLREK